MRLANSRVKQLANERLAEEIAISVPLGQNGPERQQARQCG
jgi:hypothetical protein